MKTWNLVVTVLACLILLAGNFNPGTAQEGTTEDPLQLQDAKTIAPGAIGVQGRLTNAAGVPLNGTYLFTFRLYETVDAVDALCLDNVDITVTEGLFSGYMDYCYDNLTGQKVWLGISAEGDPEMTPRQVIYPVPYAITLVPRAQMIATTDRVLSLSTSHATGTTLLVDETAVSGVNYAISAASHSPDGFAGYFYNYSSGTGVAGFSVGGPGVTANSLGTALVATSAAGSSISLEGTGVLTSTAESSIWISGNDVRPYGSADTTLIAADSIGGAYIRRNAASGTRNVVLPITLPGPLYGQDVTLTGLDIYWSAETEFDAIMVVLMRRQTGACPTCYVNILDSRPAGGVGCQLSVNPTGCVQHYNLTSNNIITDDSGILYLTLELAFNGSSTWIDLGGIRLTLQHH